MHKGLQQIGPVKPPDAGEARIGSSIVTDANLLPAIMEHRTSSRAVVHVLPENIPIEHSSSGRRRLRHRKVELVLGRP
jgi:hypothetical protein